MGFGLLQVAGPREGVAAVERGPSLQVPRPQVADASDLGRQRRTREIREVGSEAHGQRVHEFEHVAAPGEVGRGYRAVLEFDQLRVDAHVVGGSRHAPPQQQPGAGPARDGERQRLRYFVVLGEPAFRDEVVEALPADHEQIGELRQVRREQVREPGAEPLEFRVGHVVPEGQDRERVPPQVGRRTREIQPVPAAVHAIRDGGWRCHLRAAPGFRFGGRDPVGADRAQRDQRDQEPGFRPADALRSPFAVKPADDEKRGETQDREEDNRVEDLPRERVGPDDEVGDLHAEPGRTHIYERDLHHAPLPDLLQDRRAVPLSVRHHPPVPVSGGPLVRR